MVDEPAAGPPLGLPGSFRLAFGPALRTFDDGSVMLGGSPTRLLRFSPAGAAVLAALQAGATVAEAGPGAGALARRLLDAAVVEPLPPPTGGPTPADVTVVVPVRDRAAALPRLLASLGPCAEVVVVDDGSTDDSGGVAERAGARVVRHDRARGPAAARNRGLNAASTPYVAFLDSDVVPEPDWLLPLLAQFADPAVVAVAARVVSDRSPDVAASARPLVADVLVRYEAARSPLDLGPRRGAVGPGRRLSYVPAAALVVRREPVIAAGGFDERLRFGEDVDLVWRLVRAGSTVRYEPAARVLHAPRSSLLPLLHRRVGYGSAAAPLALRHPGTLRPLAGSTAGVAAWLAAGSGHPAAACGILAQSTLRLRRRLGAIPHAPLAAAHLALRGQERAAHQLADSLTRVWLPLAMPAALRWRPARRALVAAVVLPAARDWLRLRPDLAFPAYAGLRLLDDAAYCAGVWLGCARHRTALPLLPELSRTPGRRMPARWPDRRGWRAPRRRA